MIKNVINDIFIDMKKNIIRLTEGELTNLIKRILKEDSTTNCVKEYKSPYPGDPYEYRIGVECQWETKSDETKNLPGKKIPNWISLDNNEKANKKLDKWFPNAKSDCSKCKNGAVKKTVSPDLIKKKTKTTNDCPLNINCMTGVWNRPKLCDNPEALKICVKKGTSVSY